MITSSPTTLAIALLAGFVAGGIFFAGLWHTVRRIADARHPALLMVSSFVLRAGVVLGAFFLVGRGNFDRMLFCLAGFLIARLIVMRVTRDRNLAESRTGKEATSASQS